MQIILKKSYSRNRILICNIHHNDEHLLKTRSTYIESIDLIIRIFIEIIHDILSPSRESIDIIIEIHISPVDDEVIRSLISPLYIICHHHRISLFLCNLIDPLDVVLYLISELLSRELGHKSNSSELVY